MKDPSASPFAFPELAPEPLKARKRPRQLRSQATVDVIFAAATQVLVEQGPSTLTTTRVAERAGVSVGTLYQYFPHKRALLFGLLQRHLASLARAVEQACDSLQGAALPAMTEGLVTAFLDVRASDIDASRALYLIAADLDARALLTEVFLRIKASVTRLLASAERTTFVDLDAAAHMVCVMLSGITRTILERTEAQAVTIVKAELPTACLAYLRAVTTAS